MVWIFAISAATTRRAISNRSSLRHLPVGDDLDRPVGIAQAGILVRRRLRDLAEFVDEDVVLAHEHVVQERQPDRPVVGHRDRFLAGPFGLDRIAAARRPGRAGRTELRQIAERVARRAAVRLHHRELGGIVRVAPHAAARIAVIAVDLRGVPPRGVVVARRLGRAFQIGLALMAERARRRHCRRSGRPPSCLAAGSRVAAARSGAIGCSTLFTRSDWRSHVRRWCACGRCAPPPCG